MQLIGPLCGGIVGAANGTVDLFRRGTTARVTYYADFEGTSAVSPSAAVPLDANGGLVAFVNELVLCVVKDSGGNIVRTFVAGDSAAAVEVISDSFTGADYVTTASGVSKPTTLQSVLDLWNNSAGASDFQVLFGGGATALSAAFAAVGGFYFNVKSSTYGAVGDGLTDDSAAIAAALNACVLAGGGVVFFPAGTYRITGSITGATAGVTLLGTGHESVIKNDTPASATITSSFRGRIEGLRFECGQANAASTIVYDGDLVVRNCWFNESGLHTGLVFLMVAGMLTVRDCSVTLGQTGKLADTTAALSRASFIGNRITVSSAVYATTMLALGNALGTLAIVLGNTFDLTAVVAGASTIVAFTDAPAASLRNKILVGNAVAAVAGPTVTFCSVAGAGAYSATYQSVVQFGNSVPDCVTTVQLLTSVAVSHQGMLLSERVSNRQYTTFNGAFSVAADPVRYAYVEVESSSVAVSAPVFGQPPSVGLDLVYVWYQNNAGPSGLVTMDAFVKGLANFTVNANSVSYYFFRSVERGASTRKWALVGSAVNLTP